LAVELPVVLIQVEKVQYLAGVVVQEAQAELAVQVNLVAMVEGLEQQVAHLAVAVAVLVVLALLELKGVTMQKLQFH
jgi:hypothetical protein